MSKVIRISEETFIRLQELAEPLVDTPATVIDRLLDFYEREQRKPENVRRLLENRQVGSLGIVREASLMSSQTRYGRSPEAFGDFDYPPLVPSLFLAPADPEHIRTSIQRTVPYAKAERFILPRQRIQLQRAIEGASTFNCYGMSEANRSVFESMRPGDYVLITESGTGEYNLLARVLTKFESEELGRELWPVDDEDAGGEEDQPLSLIYAISDVQKVTIDQSKLNKALGYSPRYSLKGAMRVDPKRIEAQLVQFGSVEGLLWDL